MGKSIASTPRFFLLLPRSRSSHNYPNPTETQQRLSQKREHNNSHADYTTAPGVIMAQSKLRVVMERPGRFRHRYTGFSARVSPAGLAADAFGGPGWHRGSAAHPALSDLQSAGRSPA